MPEAALSIREPRLERRSSPAVVVELRPARRPTLVVFLTLLALVLWLVVLPLQFVAYFT